MNRDAGYDGVPQRPGVAGRPVGYRVRDAKSIGPPVSGNQDGAAAGVICGGPWGEVRKIMSRPETAMEPSMEEILASIRKIIAEEPSGSPRPKPVERTEPVIVRRAAEPAPQSAVVEVAGEAKAEADVSSNTVPADADMAGAERTSAEKNTSHPEAEPSGELAGGLQSDVDVAPFASDTEPADVIADVFAAPPAQSDQAVRLHAGSAATMRMGSAPLAQNAAPLANTGAGGHDAMFGRLAEALRASSKPASTAVTSDSTAPAGMTSTPARKASSSPAAILDDLEDLLAEDVEAAPDSAAAADAEAPRSIDFGAIVPGRDEDNEANTTSADAEAPAELTQRAPKSAQAEVFGKMLRARLGLGTKPGEGAPAQKATAVTAREVDPADRDSHVGSVRGMAPSAGSGVVQDAGTSTGGSAAEMDEAEESEEVKSALGALVAGLAASSTPANTSSAEAFAADTRSSSHDEKISQSSAASNAAPTSSNARVPSHHDADLLPAASRSIMSSDDADQAPSAASIEPPAKPPVVAARISFGDLKPPSSAAPASTPAERGTPAAPVVGAAVPDQVVAKTEVTAVPPQASLPQVAGTSGLTPAAMVAGAVGVRTVEDIVAELLRPMLREWLSENMPRMVEKALRIELAEGLKTINQPPGSGRKGE